MINKIIRRAVVRFSHGDMRSIRTKKNIIGNGITKISSIIISLILIPITIKYVNPETYGVWLAISSIIGWMAFFDIGISNGLRNKLAGAFAIGDFNRAKTLVSTAYMYLTIIFISLFLILAVLNFFIDWGEVLNITGDVTNNLNLVILIIIFYFCFNSIFSIINIILLADQRSAESSLRSLIVQIVSFIFIFILTKTTQGSLLLLTIALCFAPLLVQLYYNIYLFRNRYEKISPALEHIDLRLGKEILSLGFKFFIIQISGIVLFQSSNFLIIRYFGPQEVTSYNIAFKYFSILTMSMSIFLAPFWSAVSEAYEINDLSWIKRIVNKYLKIGFGLSLIGLVMLVLSSFAYQIWIGNEIKIEFSLSLSLFFLTLVSIFGGIFVSVLNGTGHLKYQYKASLISPIIFLGVSFVLIEILNMGVYSIVIAMILANFNAYFLAPWEYYKFIYKK